MKPILLFLAGFIAAASAHAQTVITGPFNDASGAPASCSLAIRPVSVVGASTTTIQYQIIGGDLTGTLGGYGTPRGTLRAAPLALLPGTYSVFQQCVGGFGSKTYTWNVPVFSLPISSLNGGTHYTWSQVTSTWATTPGNWASQ